MSVKSQLAVAENCLISIDPDRVMPFGDQPRKRFRGIKQLADSIKLVGQRTPIQVNRLQAKHGVSTQQAKSNGGRVRNRTPQQFDSLAGAVTAIQQRLDRYVTMSHADLVAMVKSRPKATQRALLMNAKVVVSDAEGLARALLTIVESEE
jgi:hypothetical protein